MPRRFVLCQRDRGTHEILSAAEVHLERLRERLDRRHAQLPGLLLSSELVTYQERREEAEGIREDWDDASEALAEARRRRRARRVRADAPGEGERRIQGARLRFERWTAEASAHHEAEDRRHAAEWGWPVEAVQLLDAMDELDLRLFVAVHHPSYRAHDDRRRCPMFDDELALRDLLTAAAQADPGLTELVRNRAAERLQHQTERFLAEHAQHKAEARRRKSRR